MADRSIWLRTFAVSALYLALIGAAYRWWVRPRIADEVLALAASIALVQALLVLGILAGVMARRAAERRRGREEAVVREAVDEIVAAAAAGVDPLPRARALAAVHPRETLAHLLRAARSLRGEARQRIEWTARSLGEEEAIAAVDPRLAIAAPGPLLARALAADRLKPHAPALATNAIPAAIASRDPEAALRALELLAAWRLLLPVRGIASVARHPDRRIRAAACAALAWAIPAEGDQPAGPALLEALRDPHPSVRAAAARSAGALRLDEAAHELESLLADPVPEVSLAAAFALASLPQGEARLRRVSLGTDRLAASHAFEALEKRALGRLEAS